MLRLTINPLVFPKSCLGAGNDVQPLLCSFPAPSALNGAGSYTQHWSSLQWADAGMLTLPGECGHPGGIQPDLARGIMPCSPSSPLPAARQARAGGCFLLPVAAVPYGLSPAPSLASAHLGGEQKTLILGILSFCCAINTEILRALKMPHDYSVL